MSAARIAKFSEPSDAALLEKWAAGDAQCGAQLFDRYFAQVVRFFRNKAPDYDDLVQRTFLGVLEGRERLVDPAKFRSYLFSIAYHLLRDEQRVKLRRPPPQEFRDSSIQAGRLPDRGRGGIAPHPVDLLAARREQRLLLGALRRLNFDDQVLLELYFFEALNAREIGELMQRPEGTIRSRLRSAKASLKQRIHSLSRDRQLLDSTISGLEDWAASLRLQFELS